MVLIVLLFLISFLVLVDFGKGLTAAFLFGLLRDFWEAGVLGVSSFKFLILGLLLNLYKRKFRAESFRYLLPFTFFVLVFWEISLMGRIGNISLIEKVVREAFWESLGIIPVFWIFSRIWYKIWGGKGKIRV